MNKISSIFSRNNHLLYTKKVDNYGNFIFCVLVTFFAVQISFAQSSKKVKALKAQQTQLQKKIKTAQLDLAKTKKDVQRGQNHLHYIGIQLEDRLAHIRSMECEMDTVEAQIVQIRAQMNSVDSQLTDKKQKYARALRMMRQFPKIQSPVIFVLSAKNFTQLYRRARYAREYATFQHDVGIQIQQKQSELMEVHNRYLIAKNRMVGLVREVMLQRRRLNDEHVAQKKQVDDLKQRQQGLNKQISSQQRELLALNKKIDELVAYEIEQARRRAEEAARKKAEEERRRAVAQEARQKSVRAEKSSTGVAMAAQTSGKSSAWLTAEDRQLNGSFEQNRGRLPVPLTGQYFIGNRFGTYSVPGLSHVTLDNKGTNYVGKKGARARAVFDGEISAVFRFSGSWNVLVRHGSYISVYCNLSSVIVQKGQKVRARDLLGTVQNDGSGNCVLHFQLRKETIKLNPETWIGK